MPSRAYTSLLQDKITAYATLYGVGVNALSGLYLIVTLRKASQSSLEQRSVNALSGLYLIVTEAESHFSSFQKFVSMPSRAYTSLLQYPFKNLGFMRFPEPIFAGICQNILIITHFHAC